MNTEDWQSAALRSRLGWLGKPEKSAVRHALLPAAAGALFALLSRPC